ncbi:short-chain dehydrogenase [Colletotrichum plurivorum]|uniref:Short-chain dehydrogenase n=1 Tax=Colletotrichum plurivorum TaxID=2175906 RepID=A0A8H6JRW6_9PEZI|nr:short-chain dehydrogenase [Colletotrichum plurivorum]
MSKYTSAHQDPQGPGDARPTALQIIADEGLATSNKFSGKTAFITGANQGIGLETARALHEAGMTVYLGVRDLAKGREAIADIKSSSSSSAPLQLIEISLDSLASVRKAAGEILTQTKDTGLNILILNAGVMFCPESKTPDEFETHIATNYLGHFLLFHLLRPALLAAASPTFNSRIISLTSALHRLGPLDFDDLHFDKNPYHPLRAYARSKTAKIYLANEVERRYGPRGVHGLSVHPGSVLTMISRYTEAGPLKMPEGDWDELRYIKSPAQGAATSVLAAVGVEWEGKGAVYLADCAEQGPAVDPSSPTESGYASWAFDEEKAGMLWREACKLVQIEDDGEAS